MPAADGSGGIGHLYLVRHVHHHPQAAAVDFDVVAHIAEFHHLVGVARGVDVARIDAGGEVEVVEGAFVGTHVALVEHVESGIFAPAGVARRVVGGVYHHHIVAARREQCRDDGYPEYGICLQLHSIIISNVVQAECRRTCSYAEAQPIFGRRPIFKYRASRMQKNLFLC